MLKNRQVGANSRNILYTYRHADTQSDRLTGRYTGNIGAQALRTDKYTGNTGAQALQADRHADRLST